MRVVTDEGLHSPGFRASTHFSSARPSIYPRDPDPEIVNDKLWGTKCFAYVCYFLNETVSGAGSLFLVLAGSARRCAGLLFSKCALGSHMFVMFQMLLGLQMFFRITYVC